MGLSLETRFGFRYIVRLWTFVWTFGNEHIANSEINHGIVQLLLQIGEEWKSCKVSRKWLETRRWESVCFPLVSQGTLTEEWRLTRSSMPSFLYDIYSCDCH